MAGAARAEELTVDPYVGSFTVVIRRMGLLKSLAHDHVVDVRERSGTAVVEASTGSVALEIDAGKLEIDEPDARKAAGFPPEIGPSDRAKIRATMRGAQGLDVLRYPKISFRSQHCEPAAAKGTWNVTGDFSLHGTTRTLSFPVTVETRPDGYWVAGEVRIVPSQYGIQPFVVAGGLIKTRDEAEVRFRLALRRGPILMIPEPTPPQ